MFGATVFLLLINTRQQRLDLESAVNDVLYSCAVRNGPLVVIYVHMMHTHIIHTDTHTRTSIYMHTHSHKHTHTYAHT
jgi:hypothetical protein